MFFEDFDNWVFFIMINKWGRLEIIFCVKIRYCIKIYNYALISLLIECFKDTINVRRYIICIVLGVKKRSVI